MKSGEYQLFYSFYFYQQNLYYTCYNAKSNENDGRSYVVTSYTII